jgi:DNA-binding NtrC family response regulator
MAGCIQILLVEDPSDTARLYPLLLKLGKYQVTTAKTHATAAALCSETHFDLLISDLWLPDGNGYSLLKCVRQSRPSIQAILVTQSAVSWSAEAALASGFSIYLVKPLTCQRLGDVIDRVLSGPEEPLPRFSG